MPTETLWMIVMGCAAATFIWRALGVVVVKRIDAHGAFFQWITCVSYAMVAGLIFRMIIMPGSELASVPVATRIAAVAIAFAAYYLTRRHLVAGVLAGGLSLSAMAAWLA
ncbi:MAG: AzlD domain-containing protein [Gammaproteobacteria bacterium]|nr:AzlD domain-containing protein [Gammaproteobacteria bacterium]MDH3535492.1 AzlD domain-containing protein [Gammaproteobacteria bacterium]